MNQHRSRARLSAVAVIVACAASLWLAMPRAARAQADLDRVVASIDGDPITVQDLKAFAALNHVTLANPDDMNSPENKAVLKGIIAERLLQSEVKKYQNKVDERQINEYIANFEQNAGLNDQQLRAQLQAQGHSYEEFRKHAKLELQKMMMIQKEVRQKVNISSDDVKAYYDAHPQEFIVGKEHFKLAQILIAVPPKASPAEVEAAHTKAETIRKQLLNGADFGNLARQYSDDDSKSQGGELGDFSRGEIIDPIQNAIDNLKVGDISEPVRTDHGFHIVKLEAHGSSGVKPLAEVSAQIHEKLVTQRAEQKFATWVQSDLVKQHYIETFN